MYRNLISTTRLSVALILFAVLSGCAAGPVKLTQPPSELSVTQVRALIAEQGAVTESLGDPVLWGGTVLSVANLADNTQIEIMAHPLDRRQRPMIGRTAQGRFVASYEGFAEPLDFPAGRVVTVLGSLGEPVKGSVGEATYVYPSIQVIDSHLWNEQDRAPRSGVTFGIGINLGN